MDNILKRLKAAKGPSRELDAVIWCFETSTTFDGLHTEYLNGRPMRVLSYIDEHGDARTEASYANYTASIDAALALVERMLPNALWRIEKHKDPLGSTDKIYRATAGIAGEQESAYGKTAPIAILIALFSALEAGHG